MLSLENWGSKGRPESSFLECVDGLFVSDARDVVENVLGKSAKIGVRVGREGTEHGRGVVGLPGDAERGGR